MLSKLLNPSRDSHNPGNHLLHPILVLMMATMLLLFQTNNVSAAQTPIVEGVDDGTSITALDALCVNGLVINHQEHPLSNWTVTATYLGTDTSAQPQTAVSGGNGGFHFDLPVPGRWLFSIAIPSDWKEVTDSSFEVDIVYGTPDCVNIRFKVEQEIEVIVLKIDDEHTPLEGWTITATPGPGNTFVGVVTAVTGPDGRATFVLPPGEWIFTEAAPAGVTWWQPVMPVNGVQSLNVTAPGPYLIRFKNDVKIAKYGCIEVTKFDVPPSGDESEAFGLPGWPIRIFRLNGKEAASGTTDAFGRVSFRDLPFGPYIVREVMLDGWEAVTPTAYEVVLTRDDEDCQQIVFRNKQKEKGFCFEGQKLDAVGPVGIPGWQITATPLETGGIAPEPAVTDGQGKFRIDFPLDDYRIPGSSYEVCEEVRDGWTSVSPTCHTVTLPKYPSTCVPVPPFVNRQTNEPHPEPKSDFPQKHGKRDHGRDGGKHWQPENSGTCSVYHTVRRGESLYSIAPQYGTNGQALLNANPWVRGQRNRWVYVGQKVCIP